MRLLVLGLALAAMLAGVRVAPADGSAPAIYTGATGRVALPDWYYRADPGNVGLARGWRGQRFAGRLVRLPYVPNAWPVTGAAGRRNFNGSVGWYRTTVDVAKAGAYALRFESVNHRAAVWVDGRPVGTHKGCRCGCRTGAARAGSRRRPRSRATGGRSRSRSRRGP